MSVILQEKQDCAWMETAVQEFPSECDWSTLAVACEPKRGYEIVRNLIASCVRV